MKINGKSTNQLFNSEGEEAYRSDEIVDFESVLTNSVISHNSDSVFDFAHWKRANDAKIVEEEE